MSEPVLDEMVLHWLKSDRKRNRPSCPCGYVGNNRNIMKHRYDCRVWQHYAREHKRLIAQQQ